MNREIWTFRPAPQVAAVIDGMVASGEYPTRSCAVNTLLAMALDYMPSLDGSEMIEIPIRDVVRLGLIMRGILEKVDPQTTLAALEAEFRIAEIRMQKLLDEQDLLTGKIARVERRIQTARGTLKDALERSLRRDQDRAEKLEALIERLEKRMEDLREAVQAGRGELENQENDLGTNSPDLEAERRS